MGTQYVCDSYVTERFIENDVHISFRNGGKRNKGRKVTPIQIEKQNHWNRVNNCRRTIQANFKQGDLWVTFAYRGGTRKEMDAFRRDMEKLQNLIRAEYCKAGHDFRWIRRLEIGKRGGLHAHFVMNAVPDCVQILQKCWKQASKDSGRVHIEPIDEDGGFDGLAKYICKDPTEEIQGQLRLLISEDQKKLYSISSSRNLKRPQPIRKRVNPWSIKEILTGNRIIRPTRGYYIEKDSVRMGISKFTGLPYLHYRERKLDNPSPPVLQEEKCNDHHVETSSQHEKKPKNKGILAKAKEFIGKIWRK